MKPWKPHSNRIILPGGGMAGIRNHFQGSIRWLETPVGGHSLEHSKEEINQEMVEPTRKGESLTKGMSMHATI